MIAHALDTSLPGVVERSGVVDRAGWVRANTGTFAALIGKLEAPERVVQVWQAVRLDQGEDHHLARKQR